MITKTLSFEAITSLIDELSKQFTIEARKADQENSFPVHNFQMLKDHQLLGLIIPQAFGGLGMNFAQYQHCIRKLAKGCASTAAAFNMHNIILGALADLPFNDLIPKQRDIVMPFVERIFREVVQEKKVIASATSEPGIGARYSKTKTTYEKTDDGYLINGVKSFVSMCEYADYYSIIANKKSLTTPASSNHLTFFFNSSRTTWRVYCQ